METIVLGGGCFWCVEAVFLNLKGVRSIKPGYSGGNISNPTYREVCSGKTGHAEIVIIEYFPEIIELNVLLAVFFATHDPTSLNRQGGDVGTQYRSVIFTSDDSQAEIAKRAIELANDDYSDDIVTTVEPLGEVFIAEDYHHNYFAKNKETPYCNAVIAPKIAELKKKFSGLI